jgi:hypothetical protein
MDEERYSIEKDIYSIPADAKKNYNYRLMKQNEIPSWFIEQPKNLESNKEYGRGNRVRKQINYSDEAADDQLFNMTEIDDYDNNNLDENDYSVIEVPKIRKEPKDKPRPEVDIDQLIAKPKQKIDDEIFEEDN